MEDLFELFKGVLITHPSYRGVVCGYCEAHFILAVETKDMFRFFRAMKGDCIIAEEYKDLKYRYVFEDECTILKQMRCQELKEKQEKQEAIANLLTLLKNSTRHMDKEQSLPLTTKPQETTESLVQGQ